MLSKIAASFVFVVIIGSCVHYAESREQFRRLDLHAEYQAINHESFGDSLPDVPVSWNDLTDNVGVTIGEDDGIRIELDRSLKTRAEVVRVLEHEACHIAVGEDGADGHGQRFQSCMLRYH